MPSWRVMRSVAEPAWNGTTMRTGWVGQSCVACANAGEVAMRPVASMVASAMAPVRCWSKRKDMGFLAFWK